MTLGTSPWLAVAVALALAVPLGAAAALGEPAGSVASDRKALNAVSRGTTDLGRYSVEEIESGSGTVREYVAPDGTVFAIAWRGRAHPDLGPLLGRYSDAYHAALKRTPRTPGRHSLEVKGDDVVVQKWGHMRDLRGRAYAPSLLPPGVNLDEIR